jgi:hypothetical protein
MLGSAASGSSTDPTKYTGIIAKDELAKYSADDIG